MTGTPKDNLDIPVKQLRAAEMQPQGLIKSIKKRKAETKAYYGS